MNKFIKEQLAKCHYANIQEYNDQSTTIIINGIRPKKELLVGKFYEIELAGYIINPPPSFNLSTNWNNGTHPTCENMNVEIIELMGDKMVKFCGSGSDNIMWTGWVPIKSILSFKEILI